MYELLYLHGFGEANPEHCRVARALRRAAPNRCVHTPCYHPGGEKTATRIQRTLADCEEIIERSGASRVHLIGYSFGGLLSAILASRRKDLIENLLLLAPAIDNFDRNFAGRKPETWHMPPEYVEELQLYPARPEVVRPTTLVHGMLDVDNAGSAPWRIMEWATQQSFDRVYLLEGVDHSLEPWLSDERWTNDNANDVPTFRHLVEQLLR
jgi:pimeloyl-ACP methyl ester carboxylesterase